MKITVDSKGQIYKDGANTWWHVGLYRNDWWVTNFHDQIHGKFKTKKEVIKCLENCISFTGQDQ